MGADGKRNSGTRQSALWGSGTRGGERRSSALWGRGGRLAAALLVAAFALCAPLAALADPGNGQSKAALVTATRTASPKASRQSTFVPPALLERAQANGNQRLHVIIQATGGTGAAASAFAANGQRDGGTVSKRLSLINGVAVDLKAKWIMRLAKVPGLVVTLDAPVETATAKLTNAQLWPYVSGNAKLWGSTWQPAPDAPTIAIVDSGLDATKNDFAGRAYPQVNLSSSTPNAPGDGDGHGTFVAGIAAGGNQGYVGASPNSHVIPIRVMDDNGAARTSDVVAAAQWILANKDTYNIRVANFSLHSATATHFYYDPLDRAVEKLWLNGVVVVAAAGNYGTAAGPSGVLYSPGNDPFVITVGAVDIGTLFGTLDDSVAPWSAWGNTEDGFAKPELGAPGRYMIGPVSNGTLTLRSGRSRRLARVHGALGHLVRRSGRRGRRRAAARAAPGLDARPGEGRADAHRQAVRQDHELGDRRRRGLRERRGGGHHAPEPERGAQRLPHERSRQRPGVRRAGLGRRGNRRRLLVGRLVVGCLVVGRFVGQCFLGRRLVVGCLVGGRLLGRRLLGRRFLGGRLLGRRCRRRRDGPGCPRRPVCRRALGRLDPGRIVDTLRPG